MHRQFGRAVAAVPVTDVHDQQPPATATHLTDSPVAPPPRWSPARLAYWFYAAAGAVIGQTWVAVTHVPWAAGLPAPVRVVAVLPFALCLELLAMTLAAMADERMRLGERAYGFRVFSAAVAAVAVGILVVGHLPDLYWSAGFGLLSAAAYLLWLLHAAARRRDALRRAGKLADTAPDYGLWRRLRHPLWSARAAELARAGSLDPLSGRWQPLSLHESLEAARQSIRADKRRPAIARAVERVVRADQADPLMAEIAVRTLDLDRLAAGLAQQVNYSSWVARLAPAVTALPATGQARRTWGRSGIGDDPAGTDSGEPDPLAPAGDEAARSRQPPVDLMRHIPIQDEPYQRWRTVWADLTAHPDAALDLVAGRHQISRRQVERIRAAGEYGLLTSPIPPALLMAAMLGTDPPAGQPDPGEGPRPPAVDPSTPDRATTPAADDSDQSAPLAPGRAGSAP
ncbi:hypothetical protein [Phytohabitans houttuyneae]|uniref:Uncharacterized protein n=1 Tax=Phytohabitans houttuyneae TaxID=1076126 RepID=A0A6V8K639_9ACTN|nr:hypothetical protein [Phytohabitans houttuyneae]GFJ77456.1 hypothetical protein Phou_016360 [Phytohabitans houttuyneae]